MFKPNPRQQVITKAKHLFGVQSIFSIKVTGERLNVERATALGLKPGLYYTECLIDGKHIASAGDRDWRNSYKRLRLAVEQAWENKV